MSTHERREVHYSGRVQGVGFRYTTREIAGRFNISGYVENLSDGRVHLVVEGEATEIERFLAAIDRRLARYIADIETKNRSVTGEFADFSIRH